MAIGSSLGITLPTQGSTLTWGSALNTELNKIITAIESQVPASAIDFSADFDVNGFAFTSVKAVTFDVQATSPTANLSAYFNSDGNFTIRDGSNREVVLTSAGGLNNASAGGLGDSGGDYGTGGITFDWDGTRYNAKNGAGSDAYADIRLKNIILRDGSSNDITIVAPSLGGNYTLTLPNAVPAASGTFLQMDTSGNVTASNDTSVEITTSADITLSGSAEVKHGTRTKSIHALAGRGNDTDNTDWVYSSFFDEMTCGNSSTEYFIPIDLEAGCRITQVDVFYYGNDTGTKTARLATKTAADGTGAVTVTDGSATDSGSGASQTLTIPTINYTVLAGDMVTLEFVPDDANDRLAGIKVTYDRP